MKAKRLILVLAAVLLAAAGLWLARSSHRAHASDPSSASAATEAPNGPLNPGEMPDPPTNGHRLAPPDPARRFMEFTPEQRVEFARRGHGPGG